MRFALTFVACFFSFLAGGYTILALNAHKAERPVNYKIEDRKQLTTLVKKMNREYKLYGGFSKTRSNGN
jgi:uncharacterized protein